jgi:RHS repeat-associated protein
VNPILFASREFDAETSLYYNRARYLDPSTGRWTTQDPLGFAAGDANLYRYVGNMATMATDPSGNIFFVPFLVYGGIALAGVGTAGLLYSAHRYDYAREHYLSRPIHQWTPELQAEYRAYVRTTDWIAAGSEVTGWTGVSMVAAPYMGYWGGYAWTAGGTGGRLIVGGAGLGGLGYAGYDGYTIYRDWRLMEGPEQFRRVGNLAGPTLVGLGTGPRYFQLGAAVGRLPGRVPTRVDPWGRWAVMVDGDRHQTLLFHPRYASPFAPGPLGPGRDSYITAAIVMPDGRVVVLEGMHRLVGAQSGAIIPEHLGGIGGWPWWLHYDLFIRPPH